MTTKSKGPVPKDVILWQLREPSAAAGQGLWAKGIVELRSYNRDSFEVRSAETRERT